MVPCDKNGQPILPLNVGVITVNCLGEVCMQEHFYTEHYIFPVGYSVNRWLALTCSPYFLTDANILGATSQRVIPMWRCFIIAPSLMVETDLSSKSLQMICQISPSLLAQQLVPGLSSCMQQTIFKTGNTVIQSLGQTSSVWVRRLSSTLFRSC